jgi:glycosyltransferase 2 family protein
MIKKLLIGIAVSAVFFYFTLKGVDLKEVLAELRHKSYEFLLPVAAVFILTQIVRSLRWGAILSPIKAINQRALFPITSVGFMAIIIAPMRLGEIVRPYLINVKESVPLGSGIATILIERTMDLLVLLLFLFVILSQGSLPHWIAGSGAVLLGIILLAFLFIILFMVFPAKIKKFFFPITKPFPRRVAKGFEQFIENTAAGFRVISSISKFVKVFLLSLLVWLLLTLAVYLLFSFYKLPLGILAALVVTTITALGISLPAAPGFIGNFQFACIVALSFYGVAKNEAFTFAMVYYLTAISVNIVLGLIFLPFMNIPFRQMFKNKGEKPMFNLRWR